jgi:hypothetical protein
MIHNVHKYLIVKINRCAIIKSNKIKRGGTLLPMKKIIFTLILIVALLALFVSCTNLNLPKRIIHTLNLKIPGLTQSFELAPFATETTEASIVSVLPGFEFITQDGTAMRLFYVTQMTIGYDDISDQLEVDIQKKRITLYK